jgi:hypothetical protein
MDGLRVPQRFWAFALPAFALATATGLDAARRALRGRVAQTALVLGACTLLALELAPKPLEWSRIDPDDETPRTSRLLREDPSVQGLLILPVFGDHREAESMILATSHWKPIANGYSGFLPVSYRRLQRMFSPLPQVEQIPELRRLGLTHLQVRWDRISSRQRRATYHWLVEGERTGRLRLLLEEDQVLLYKIVGD